MKKITFFLLVLSTLNLYADNATISATPYNFAKMYIGHGKPYFLEIGAESCPSCKIMGHTLYEIKKENPKYNILYINIGNDREIAQQLGVQMIPTQIIYNSEGAEVYRHIGKLNEIKLDEIFNKYNF